jgi:hypothetical protein
MSVVTLGDVVGRSGDLIAQPLPKAPRFVPN